MRFLNENVLVGIDHLDGAAGDRAGHETVVINNPVWCSYAHSSRAAIYISQQGYVKYTQSWFDGNDMFEFVKGELSS